MGRVDYSWLRSAVCCLGKEEEEEEEKNKQFFYRGSLQIASSTEQSV